MGIKGIYKEIGTGKRISLTKLATDHLEQTGRPLKVAIDISIWQFQVQAAKGGSNPAIRTLFYRLLRLLGLHIEPIFIFDGPNKPVFKRNKRSGRGNGVATSMAKRMIRLFGFQSHDAPGEAEAECAFLQQNGIVDAVLSEDVDTIMFGCTKTMRNWSAEGKGKTPTHISMYDTAELRQGESGLDREGMVLVALMSGGDYLPEGIPGAGVKLACEAARAGFGKSLCRLKRSDILGLREWKDKLKHELVSNESRFFRTKHKSLLVPGDFPNLEVLGYYTHPVVSPLSSIQMLRDRPWGKPLDIVGLREFVRETFDWEYQGGAIKFIRVLAPCLLVKKMMLLHTTRGGGDRGIEDQQKEEGQLARAITNRREHVSTDGTPELRVSFTPTEIVGYSFEEEPEEEIAFGRDGIALNSDDEFDALAEEDGATAKVGPKKPFNPTEPDLAWIPESVVKFGLPLMVEDWEESQRAKAARKNKAKVPKPKVTAKLGGMQAGALDKFVKTSKNVSATVKPVETLESDRLMRNVRAHSPLGSLTTASQRHASAAATSISDLAPKSTRPSSTQSKQLTKSAKSPKRAKATPPDAKVNPWSIASSRLPSKPSSQVLATATATAAEAILIASSPPASPAEHAQPRVRRTGSPSPDNRQNSTGTSSSLHKRRSETPADGSRDGPGSGRESRPRSPVAQQQGATSRRKLARTESMPIDSPRGARNHDVFGGQQRAPLSRASTISVGPHLDDLDHDDDDDDSDDDWDLPPLSSFRGRIPKGPSPAANQTSSTAPPDEMVSITIDSSPMTITKTRPSQDPSPPASSTTKKSSPATKTATKTGPKQGKLGGRFGLRTTKVYAPRKSMPGFFKETEILVDGEADGPRGSSAARDGSRKWRQSDISVVDLTGDD